MPATDMMEALGVITSFARETRCAPGATRCWPHNFFVWNRRDTRTWRCTKGAAAEEIYRNEINLAVKSGLEHEFGGVFDGYSEDVWVTCVIALT